MIAFYHIKFLPSILKMYDLPYLNTASTAVVILRTGKNNSVVEFSINIAYYEKKRTIPGFTRIKNAKDFKNRLKQWIYTCRSLWIAGRRDSTLFGVVDDTTTTKFTGRACAVHCNSLPVVVDKVVVVVLKFPKVCPL